MLNIFKKIAQDWTGLEPEELQYVQDLNRAVRDSSREKFELALNDDTDFSPQEAVANLLDFLTEATPEESEEIMLLLRILGYPERTQPTVEAKFSELDKAALDPILTSKDLQSSKSSRPPESTSEAVREQPRYLRKDARLRKSLVMRVHNVLKRDEGLDFKGKIPFSDVPLPGENKLFFNEEFSIFWVPVDEWGNPLDDGMPMHSHVATALQESSLDDASLFQGYFGNGAPVPYRGLDSGEAAIYSVSDVTSSQLNLIFSLFEEANTIYLDDEVIKQDGEELVKTAEATVQEDDLFYYIQEDDLFYYIQEDNPVEGVRNRYIMTLDHIYFWDFNMFEHWKGIEILSKNNMLNSNSYISVGYYSKGNIGVYGYENITIQDLVEKLVNYPFIDLAFIDGEMWEIDKFRKYSGATVREDGTVGFEGEDIGNGHKFILSPEGEFYAWGKKDHNYGKGMLAIENEGTLYDELDDFVRYEWERDASDTYNFYRNEGYATGTTSSGGFIIINAPSGLNTAQIEAIENLFREQGYRNIIIQEAGQKYQFNRGKDALDYLAPRRNEEPEEVDTSGFFEGSLDYVPEWKKEGNLEPEDLENLAERPIEGIPNKFIRDTGDWYFWYEDEEFGHPDVLNAIGASGSGWGSSFPGVWAGYVDSDGIPWINTDDSDEPTLENIQEIRNIFGNVPFEWKDREYPASE